MNNVMLQLIKMFYDGKRANDPEVQTRAPVDIFTLIKEIDKLSEENERLRLALKEAGGL